jgi:rSAM/selenodomain-associated transferase 2
MDAAPARSEPALLSIIVPVLNEAALIRPFLQQLRTHVPGAEIIVVDGGSSDGTAELAAPLCDHVVTATPGRASQMNAGAGAAAGETLWFVHVDSGIPPRSATAIERVLADAAVVGGFFRIQLPQEALIYRLTDSFAHYSGAVLRIRCGDHAFFCRRAVFEQIGGFPEVPLMEDVEFFRAMHRHGKVRHVEERLAVSPRRYEALGRVRLTFAYGLIATLYAFGCPIPKLAAIYRRTCCPGSGRSTR